MMELEDRIVLAIDLLIAKNQNIINKAKERYEYLSFKIIQLMQDKQYTQEIVYDIWGYTFICNIDKGLQVYAMPDNEFNLVECMQDGYLEEFLKRIHIDIKA